ncbi:MAG: SUMF1/EgtB/PvdO family nonheme iron enzyme [Deltaproteobacteria bacterium]|nr:SUMF1/EgtB/PvdO family nonheme iron enzyme [Deltaproteobacteria bacterium]
MKPGPALEPIDDMVLIPAGSFFFGKDEIPQFLPDFWIDRHEVTVSEYYQCVRAGVCTPPEPVLIGLWPLCSWNYPFFFGSGEPRSGRERRPVNCVTWDQASIYCQWAGKRLPTEREWEKAARGDDRRMYPWGDAPPSCDRAVMRKNNVSGCGAKTTWDVCSKPDGNSPHGLCDMSGNVWEWVADWAEIPGRSEAIKIIKGGTYRCDQDSKTLKLTYQGGGRNEFAVDVVGFRCAK